MTEYTLKLSYSYKPSAPLKIQTEMENLSDVDLYFGNYSTPWDGICRMFVFTNAKGEKGKYRGIMVKRLPMNRCKDSWVLIKSKAKITKDIDLDSPFAGYDLPKEGPYNVSTEWKVIEVTKSNKLDKGKVTGIVQAKLEIVKNEV